jgi:hypothetical protein
MFIPLFLRLPFFDRFTKSIRLKSATTKGRREGV